MYVDREDLVLCILKSKQFRVPLDSQKATEDHQHLLRMLKCQG